ncbi:MAG: bifunctional UDP-4-keto-pentose/UDP-xylose synthase [Holosporaceae bacterium]|jgi:nucleoside-diphosphate-sugar epimerase|nr:bifunctional UDP-4-keto-pentose/UDP-xylose synthase [Holosporaceae bacterium]
MKILIIGAGGFIGSHLCEEILKSHKDWRVIAADITSDKIRHLMSEGNFDFRRIDILTDLARTEESVEECDAVFPLAAIANPRIYVQDPLRVFELDFEANLRIVKWAAKYGKRLIFPSTSEVYGMCRDEEFTEEGSDCVTGPICKQRWIYSCSKQMLDRVIYACGIRDNLRYTLFRPFNWVGPRLDDINDEGGRSRVVTQFLSNILYGKDLVLADGGAQIRCFTFIADGIDALIKITENKDNCADGQIFNIGNPYNRCSIRELANRILRLAERYPQLKDSVAKIKIVDAASSDYYGKSYQDVLKRVPSVKKAEELLGWKPITGMDELLIKTMDFCFGAAGGQLRPDRSLQI